MKKVVIFILLGLFAFPSVLQAQLQSTEQQRNIYQNKVVKFSKMKRSGVGLTICGTVLTVVGIGMVADGAYRLYNDTHNSLNQDDPESEMAIGSCATAIGLTATSGGVVLWIIGASKANKYRKNLRYFSFDLSPAPNQMLSLAFRF